MIDRLHVLLTHSALTKERITRYFTSMETQASHIISKVGGKSALALLLGRPYSTIQRWESSGWIRSQYHDEIISKSAETETPVLKDDFFKDAWEKHPDKSALKHSAT